MSILFEHGSYIEKPICLQKDPGRPLWPTAQAPDEPRLKLAQDQTNDMGAHPTISACQMTTQACTRMHGTVRAHQSPARAPYVHLPNVSTPRQSKVHHDLRHTHVLACQNTYGGRSSDVWRQCHVIDLRCIGESISSHELAEHALRMVSG